MLSLWSSSITSSNFTWLLQNMMKPCLHSLAVQTRNAGEKRTQHADFFSGLWETRARLRGRRGTGSLWPHSRGSPSWAWLGTREHDWTGIGNTNERGVARLGVAWPSAGLDPPHSSDSHCWTVQHSVESPRNVTLISFRSFVSLKAKSCSSEQCLKMMRWI